MWELKQQKDLIYQNDMLRARFYTIYAFAIYTHAATPVILEFLDRLTPLEREIVGYTK